MFRKVYCLFEQSGTFRDEFRKLGYEAYDYDIENQFGKTDFQIDLFKEIEKCVERERSIFDSFTCDDLIIAFFPCIRFSSSILLSMRGDNYGMREWDIVKRLSYSMKLNVEQSNLYQLFCNMFKICIERNLKLIVENPYDVQSYLNQNFPIKPVIIDIDRRLLGDKFKKPTQYWFVNVDVQNNKIDYKQPFIFGNKLIKEVRQFRGIERSLIEPKYAENFIKKYIIEKRKE